MRLRLAAVAYGQSGEAAVAGAEEGHFIKGPEIAGVSGHGGYSDYSIGGGGGGG